MSVEAKTTILKLPILPDALSIVVRIEFKKKRISGIQIFLVI